MSLQDAINIYYSSIRNIAPPNINFMIIILISFVIMSYFFITCSLSHRTSNIQNIILSHIKFIPLAFASIGAIIIYCVYGKAAQSSYALLASAKNLKQN
ncbi:hypothetical protein FACS189459_2780 [Bacilli bacterium]|nr:hypothetical protein FACS189459_2780 [Bacilli bacterium]